MIQLIANLIVFTALGGALLLIVVVIAKALIALGVAVSITLPDPAVVSVPVAISVPHCKYCGLVFLGSEVWCEKCGAVRQ